MTEQTATKKVPCEIYSRIVGYFRPIRSWNKGKQQEKLDRVDYTPEEVVNHG